MQKQEEEQPDGQQVTLDDLFAHSETKQEAPAVNKEDEDNSDGQRATLDDIFANDASAVIKEEIEVSEPSKTPSSISGEKVGEETPLPKFLIIGSTKCSTSALLRFLMVHPELKSPGETYFFNKVNL